MKFYRLVKVHEAGASAGFEWFTNYHLAERAWKDWVGHEEETVCDRYGTEIEEVQVEPTRKGILRALRIYATHNDNG